jgi:hypothetical protein
MTVGGGTLQARIEARPPARPTILEKPLSAFCGASRSPHVPSRMTRHDAMDPSRLARCGLTFGTEKLVDLLQQHTLKNIERIVDGAR